MGDHVRFGRQAGVYCVRTWVQGLGFTVGVYIGLVIIARDLGSRVWERVGGGGGVGCWGFGQSLADCMI